MSSESIIEKKGPQTLSEHVLPIQTYGTGSGVSLPSPSTIPASEYVSTLSDAEQRRIWRKLDLRLLPFVSLLYLFSFL